MRVLAVNDCAAIGRRLKFVARRRADIGRALSRIRRLPAQLDGDVTGAGPSPEGDRMRKLIVNEWITLDGVVQAPISPAEDADGGFAHAGWHLPYAGDPA